MSLGPGSRLGAYEIVSPVGAGGMGEVYLARDAKLDRDVAIKVLPTNVATDANWIARFEREAKAVAALSHPNILAIHDFGVESGVAYAVMEFLRGATLRERLRDGALPVRKAVDIAVQIARGLGAAHGKSIVHRDLKPENVFLLDDGQVKILDFGLAKASVDAGSGARADSDTVAATSPGTVMGTAGYMAPEQVRGEQVDARTDLFALGAVIYEMLSGQRAFLRDTGAETMTAVLKDDPPDLLEVRADLPPALDRIVRHCLEKTPGERFQTARDVAFALEALSGSGSTRSQAALPAAAARGRSGLLIPALTVAVTAVVAGLAGWWLRPPQPAPVRKLDLAIDNLDTILGRTPAISPDGRRVLYTADGSLWVRPLDGLDAVNLSDTIDASYASWSPDGGAVAYVKDGQLWRVALDGSKSVALGRVPPDMSGSGATCWLPDGRILLIGSDETGLTAISDRGGDLTSVLEIDRKQEIDYHEISPIPGGVLFTIHRVANQRADTIEALVNGTRKVVMRLQGESLRRPVYSPTGHLLYQRESVNPGVWAVRFSLKTLETAGAPFLVVPGASWPTLAADGTLAIVRPAGTPPDLVWVDRAGVVSRVASLQKAQAFTGDNRIVSLSPDGRRALLALQEASASEVWVYDFASGAMTQVTHGAGQAVFPIWMPGGRHVLVSGRFTGRTWNLFRVALDGGAADRLTVSDTYQFAGGITPDSRTIIFSDEYSVLWTLPLDESGKPGEPVRLTGTQALESSPDLAPDGRHLTYVSNLTGRSEVYVRPFPSGEPRLVSIGSGSSQVGMPVWSPDGKEIVYRLGDRLMSAAVAAGPGGIAVSTPRPVAVVPPQQGFSWAFNVAADGRFLMTRTTGRDRISLILNWPEDLARIEAAGVGR